LREALPQTLAALTLADLRRYYQSAFRPDLAVITVIGDITPEAAKTVIEKYFGSWTAAGALPQTTPPPVPPSAPTAVAIPDASRVQDEVTLAQTIGVTSAGPDRYALYLGNAVLGGGFYSARLSRDLRKNAGLVYSIDSRFDIDKSRGVYLVQYACDPQNVSRVQAGVERELDAMRVTPVTQDELQRAKAMLLHRIPLTEGSTAGIAQGLIARWDLDLPLDEPAVAAAHYLRLSAEDIRAAFAHWVRPRDLARVALGPPPR
jgi:zinc protease